MPETTKPTLSLALLAVQGLLAGCGAPTPATSGAGTPEVSVDVPSQTQYPPAGTPVPDRDTPPQIAKAKACCKGQNECRGRGECRTDEHGCKGKNACRGKGGCKPSTASAECDGRDTVEKACCKGMNECKGLGQCKTEQHDCKGMNECKAKGGCAPSDC